MAIDLSAISDAANTALALSNLILVTPQENVGMTPQNNNRDPIPNQKLLFHFNGEETVTLESDVTDHYVEDNSSISDNIAVKPEIITTNGFIGDLNDVVPEILQPLRTAADRLRVIGAYTPSLSEAGQIAYDEALRAYQLTQTVSNAVSNWQSIASSNTGQINAVGSSGLESGAESFSNQNKQQVFFQQLYGYWRNRTLFTVQTPWAIFKNVPIMRLRAIQDADTKSITDFEMTFKVVRFAKTSTQEDSVYDYTQFQDRTFNQGVPQTNLGLQSPTDTISIGGFLA